MSRASRLSILIAGYGLRGNQWRDELAKHPSFDLVGVVDPSEKARADAASQGLSAWPSLEDALGKGDFQGVLVCSPPSEHRDNATTCLAAGRSVLIEKPLAPSVDDALAITRAAETAGQPALVAQNFWLRPRERAMRTVLSDGVIGRPQLCVITSARPPETAPPSARNDPVGILWDLAVHHFDSLRVRFKALPEVVRARHVSHGANHILQIDLLYDDGLRVAYCHSEGPPLFYYHEWMEGTEAGAAAIDERVRVYSTKSRPKRVKPPRAPAPERTILDGWAAALSGSSEWSDAEENLGTVATVEAACRSIQTSEPVALSDVWSGASASPEGRE